MANINRIPVEYEDLLDDVRFDLPRAPDRSIMPALKRAVEDFCGRSGGWLETLDPIPIVQYTQRYALTPRWDANIHRVMWVKADGTTLAKSSYWLDDEYTLVFDTGSEPSNTTDIDAYDSTETYAVGDKCSYDSGYFQCVIAITAAEAWTRANWQTVEDGILVRAVLRPTRTCTQMPQWMFQRWGKFLIAGTVARLGAQKNRPWTDLDTAAVARTTFIEGLDAAAGEAQREKLGGTTGFSG